MPSPAGPESTCRARRSGKWRRAPASSTMRSASPGNGRAAPIFRTPAIARSRARLASTTASSWSIKWCSAARRWPRPKGIRGRAIAISSIRHRAGSSPACVSPSTRPEPPGGHPMKSVVKARLPAKKPQVEGSFAADTIKGLSSRPKFMSAKHFYDETGSKLFEAITRLPEYYPTRSEIEVLRARSGEIASLIPQGAALIEFGSGSSAKIRILLEAAPRLAAYVPVDISADYLEAEAVRLRRDFPKLSVLPVAADFTRPFELPTKVRPLPRVGFFPGSTIGNFEPLAAVSFLRNAARILGRGAVLIIGVDLVKSQRVLHAAYNDAAGTTA